MKKLIILVALLIIAGFNIQTAYGQEVVPAAAETQTEAQAAEPAPTAIVEAPIEAKPVDPNTTISKDKKVKFDYKLTIDGQEIESSEGKAPIEYTHGTGQIIPGLESQLEGLKVGDTKTVVVEPKDGYGEIMQEALKEVPKTSFPADAQLEQGMVVELRGDQGEVIPGIIWEIKDSTLVVNFNHPLAGKTLTFDVKIVTIE